MSILQNKKAKDVSNKLGIHFESKFTNGHEIVYKKQHTAKLYPIKPLGH